MVMFCLSKCEEDMVDFKSDAVVTVSKESSLNACLLEVWTNEKIQAQ